MATKTCKTTASGGTGNWETDADWDEGTKPATGDAVTIPSGCPANTGPAGALTVASLVVRNNAKNTLTNVTATAIDAAYSTNPAAYPALVLASIGGGTIVISGGTWGSSSSVLTAATAGTVGITYNGTVTVTSATHQSLASSTVSSGVTTITIAAGSHAAYQWAGSSTVSSGASLVTAITGSPTFTAGRPFINSITVASGGALRLASGVDILSGSTLAGATITTDGENALLSGAALNLSGATINASGDIAIAQTAAAVTTDGSTVLNIMAANVRYAIIDIATLSVVNGEPNYPSVGDVRKNIGFGWNSTTLTGTLDITADNAPTSPKFDPARVF